MTFLPESTSPATRRLLGCLPALAIMIGGCDRGQNGDNQGAYRIAAILLQEDQFYRLNEAGMKAAAKDFGAQFFVGNSFGRVDQEMSLVETYIAKGVDALLVAPNSQAGSVGALRRAHDAGIAVIVYDTALAADFPESTIASDQVGLGASTGQAARRYIEKNLNGKAKIAILQYVSLSLELGPLRPGGFRRQLEDMPGVQIVAEQDAWLAHMATEVAETLLAAHPDLDIIWAANEGGTVGAVTAVRNTGRAGDVVVFGTDISEQLADYLLADDNVLQAVTAQKPFEMGYTTLATAVSVLRGDKVAKKTTLDGTLFTRDNPEDVRKIRQRLHELAN